MITCHKDRAKLIFSNDITGRVATYNLVDDSCYNDKGTKVKSLNSFFAGYAFNKINWVDTKYKEFILSVTKNHKRLSNIGSMLNTLHLYTNNEGYILLGLPITGYMNHPVSVYSKKAREILLKKASENPSNYTMNSWYRLMRESKAVDLITLMQDLSLDELFEGMLPSTIESILDCISSYNMSAKALLFQLLYYKKCEGFAVTEAIRELRDYNAMASKLSPKYQKYPKFLASTHKITIMQYNAFRRDYELELFKRSIDNKLAYNGSNYSIIVPEQPDDLKNEGSVLHHCVASYIDDIIKGKTQVVFMRLSDELDKPLVTIEVKGSEIIQAKGLYNRGLSADELAFLNYYANRKGFKVNSYL